MLLTNNLSLRTSRMNNEFTSSFVAGRITGLTGSSVVLGPPEIMGMPSLEPEETWIKGGKKIVLEGLPINRVLMIRESDIIRHKERIDLQKNGWTQLEDIIKRNKYDMVLNKKE